MVKKIIHIGDIHIRNVRRFDEYEEMLTLFIKTLKEKIDGDDPETIRIVVCGDLFHMKLDCSGEAYSLAGWFLKQLDEIAKTYVISGNHDLNLANLSRVDPISALFSITDFEQTYFLDKELGYESGCIKDDNIIWCLYSTFDNFNRPNIEEMQLAYPEETLIGLFHGEVKGCKTDVGFVSEKGLPPSMFSGLSCCLCGHIHKRQILNEDGTKIIYSSSLIQQDHGENYTGHGFGIWDVENETYKSYDIPNEDYGFFTFSIENEDDIENDNEKLLNL